MASKSSYRLRASTSADTSVQYEYDVFLSFRGEDTRKKFTDHLHDKLQFRGIRTFRDDPDLQRGTSISPKLLAAIERSRFAVVVLSPNYASSSWCLLELAKIVECMGKSGRIMPVFYEVDPSDVRHQRGSFAEAFAEHEKKFSGEEDLKKVQEWRDALTKVANLSGWASKDYRCFIKEILEAVWTQVYPTFASPVSESAENLVGIDSKLMGLEVLLEEQANDVCFIGIWGMGGIGKTTLARLFHHRISHHFEVAIFLPDVRQMSTTNGLVHQQEQLLCQILKDKNIQVHNVTDGVAKLKRCLCNKKVLLVLDDVDKSNQLEYLAGGKNWFGSGSIIIITTRDEHLLVSHDVQKRYRSKGLNEYEALQLFSWKAFKKDYPEDGYLELSKSILDYCRGLPLALKILGSFLYKRDLCDWESTVANLMKVPIHQMLFSVLRISYDGLNKMEQQVFLDVACFLKGNAIERVIQILDSSFGFDTRVMISVLKEKSLLTIFDNCVDMHDLIQEMGREIVRMEFEKEPGKRSQLWLREDIFHVLKENKGTEAIRSIDACLPKVEGLAWNPNAFLNMPKLKFLKLHNLVLCPGPKHLPDDLRVLEWNSYPAKSLPQNFQPVDLIELTLHHSKIHYLWHGIKYLNNLTILDLSYSENLTKTPDFTGIQNLERLILEGCTNLVYIDPSITSLRRLKVLNFKNCRSIKSFPGELEMNLLELIDLSGCSEVNILRPFEPFSGGICNQEVSCSPHRLSLVLASLKHFSSLKGLHLNDCKLGEGAIPDDIGCLSSLEHLDLSANNFISLPSSISLLSKLKCLNLADCKRLEQLPCLPAFDGTCDVTANNCISLKKFPDPPELCRLWKLSFNFINCWSIEHGGLEYNCACYGVVRPCYGVRYSSYLTVEDETNEDYFEDVGGENYGSTSSYIICSMLRRFLQEPPPFFEMYSIVIPGDLIPRWFKNQSAKHSLRQAPPDCSSCSSKWIGFALCVVVGAEENPGALGEDHANTISCSWKPGLFIPANFRFNLNQAIHSDHLCVFLLPSKHYPEHTDLTDPEFIEFLFQGGPGLKVKKCGVRALYKQQVEELDLIMRQYEGCTFTDVVEPAFSCVISGNSIPVWFEIMGNGDSVSLERPCISCCDTWMGFALCVLFEAEQMCDDLGRGLQREPRLHDIWCCWKANHFPPSKYSCLVSSSRHLCVFFIPVYYFLRLPRRVDFKFKSDACLKVKGYGVRSLYKNDLPGDLANQSFKDQLLWSIKNCRSS